MVEWMIKKVVCSKVNSLLKTYRGNVDTVRETLRKWIERINKVLSCLESLLGKIDDGELAPEEVKEATSEIQAVIREW